MGPELYVAAALAVLALGSVLSLVQLRRLRRDRDRALAELAATRAESRELADRVEALARRVAPRDEPTEFVITDIGAATGPVGTSPADGRRQVERYVDGRLFADIVLRESVVRAASLAHGVRRALRPETRHRIRFEMRREIKRARRQRRDDLKELRRELQARQRAREVA